MTPGHETDRKLKVYRSAGNVQAEDTDHVYAYLMEMDRTRHT